MDAWCEPRHRNTLLPASLLRSAWFSKAECWGIAASNSKHLQWSNEGLFASSSLSNACLIYCWCWKITFSAIPPQESIQNDLLNKYLVALVWFRDILFGVDNPFWIFLTWTPRMFCSHMSEVCVKLSAWGGHWYCSRFRIKNEYC